MRWVPGTDPLAPLELSPTERADLVARAGVAAERARTRPRASAPPEKIAERQAERLAARKHARAHARSLRAVVISLAAAARQETRQRSPGLTLADLPAAYGTALAAALASARPVAGGLCCYCGLRWTPLPNSKLPGHALCMVTSEFREALGELYRGSPAISRQQLADLLGVSISTVVAWIKPRAIERGLRWRLGGTA